MPPNLNEQQQATWSAMTEEQQKVLECFNNYLLLMPTTVDRGMIAATLTSAAASLVKPKA
jgi:hypothetical protein